MTDRPPLTPQSVIASIGKLPHSIVDCGQCRDDAAAQIRAYGDERVRDAIATGKCYHCGIGGSYGPPVAVAEPNKGTAPVSPSSGDRRSPDAEFVRWSKSLGAWDYDGRDAFLAGWKAAQTQVTEPRPVLDEVADALEHADIERDGPDYWIDLARAAVVALRSPSEEMADAAFRKAENLNGWARVAAVIDNYLTAVLDGK